MANRAQQSDKNMVDALSSILKKVRFFGYGAADLDNSLDNTFDPVSNQGPCPLIYPEDLNTRTAPITQRIQYSNINLPGSLTSTGSSCYNNCTLPPLAESYSSSHYQEEFSDKEDDQEEEDENDLEERRMKNTKQILPVLPEYSLNDVAQHDMMHDCWMILYDKVIDA